MDNASSNLTEDFHRILRETDLRIKTSARAHWTTTNILESYARVSTFVTIAGGGLVSLVVALPIAFEGLYTTYSLPINLSIFVLGGLTSIVSTFQAIFRWSERAQSHRIAASHYTNTRRRLEIMELNLPESAEELTHILEELTRLSDITPSVPEHLWLKAFRAVRNGK
ncbi:hypothetical protein ABAC460_11685 [Asticcacaulis sp. AC460]|uniref:hypothetical protein n=1 Tax=Asticcacaulis sp. AC460 TaxID=1282360 RepID=UPI0003C3FAB9|nr:hypothetical protein [Asticcacaulis sp. AC460]ESQ89530.1 hypothetical protein ABAC460_11685 [Asticcacaulis sp. AC460]